MFKETDNNIILLRNYDKWNFLLKYNVASGSIVEFLRPKDEINISGVYRKWNNSYIMFYKIKDNFYFQIETKVIPLTSNDFIIKFQKIGRYNNFQILNSQGVIFSHKYESVCYDKLNIIDPDFNEEREEDQDFFLFVFNVINNEERRNRLYSKN